MKIHTLPALHDNYSYIVEYDGSSAVVIDPSESRSVLQFLKAQNLRLSRILITHSHSDHFGGAADLKAQTRCTVIGPDRGIPHLDRMVSDNEAITVSSLRLDVLSTPGHSKSAVCWLVTGPDHPAALFTGDTLFVSGCGRIFSSGPQAMYGSLCRLAKLPGETRVYVGHEYTEENCRFALSIAPDYPPFQRRLEEIQDLLRAGRPTVPSTIETEKQANPFLLADSPVIRLALEMPDAPAWQVFAELRSRKDRF